MQDGVPFALCPIEDPLKSNLQLLSALILQKIVDVVLKHKPKYESLTRRHRCWLVGWLANEVRATEYQQ